MRLIEVPNQVIPVFDQRTASLRSEMEKSAIGFCTFMQKNDLNSRGHDFLAKTMAYKNESVIERYMADNPSSTRDDADAAWQGLLQFLVVCSLNKGSLTPSKIIDEMWHAFLLHMRDYEKFCLFSLRQMIYHDPAHDDSAFQYYAVARNCVIALFGEADVRAWPIHHKRYTRCVSCSSPSNFLFEDFMNVKLVDQLN